MAMATSSAQRWALASDSQVGGPSLGAEAVVQPGGLVGRYRIRAQIGAGGTGVVYAAIDEALARPVALKLVRVDTNKPGRVERRRTRLIREARALARLCHPNVVAVHEVGAVGVQVFVAMEYVDGPTVGAWLRATPRPWNEILDVFVQAGRGLAAAHAVGIVHRDFKPENLLLGSDGRVRVVDFGLATERPEPDDDAPHERTHERLTPVAGQAKPSGPTLAPSPSPSPTPSASSSRITRHGKVLGTPAYMSPEQSRAEPLDPRSDQYSFCVSLWEALAGERPQGPIDPTRASTASSPQLRGLPRSVLAALERGLRVDPDDRYPDMDALLAALAWRDARRRRRVGAAVAIAGLLGVALGLALAGLATGPDQPVPDQPAQSLPRK